MSTNTISFTGEDHGFGSSNPDLLQAVLDIVQHSVRLMEAVWNDKKEIKDFRYIPLISFGSARKRSEKSLLREFPGFKGSSIIAQLQRVLEKGEELDDTFSYQEEGRKHWYRIEARSFQKNKLILYFEDITEWKVSEMQVRRLERDILLKNRALELRNSELKTFYSIAAIDYKETLRTLYTCLEFIVNKDAPNLSTGGKANIRRAQSGIQKMKLLTDDVIAYSDIYSPETRKTSVNLGAIIEEQQKKIQSKIIESNPVIEVDAMPTIEGYAHLLSLLFQHLFENAIKFRKEDVAPAIKLKCARVGGEYIKHADALTDITYNVISVTDNGIGIEQKDLDKIFQIFYKVHDKNRFKGSWIGLAICKKIMNLHNVFITAESTADEKGTTFNCFFPIEENRSLPS